ncbi:MAG: FABP family protein [Actinomycetota bacterium]
MEPALHPEVEPLAFLLGTWRGEGDGEYPTTEPFRYGEEMTFEHVGDPFLLYSQRGWSLDDGAPLHFERGFLRPVQGGRVEIVFAHPLGIVEVAEGTVSGTVVDVASTVVRYTSTGSRVTALARRMELDGDALVTELSMAMEEIPLTHHVRARLRRIV